MLAASAAWRAPVLPRWATVLIGLGSGLGLVKGCLELAIGADLGPVTLLGAILLIVGFAGVARSLSRAPTGERHA